MTARMRTPTIGSVAVGRNSIQQYPRVVILRNRQTDTHTHKVILKESRIYPTTLQFRFVCVCVMSYVVCKLSRYELSIIGNHGRAGREAEKRLACVCVCVTNKSIRIHRYTLCCQRISRNMLGCQFPLEASHLAVNKYQETCLVVVMSRC